MNAIKEAHYNLGIAYLEAGQYNRAIPEFEAAIEMDSDFIGAHCALCRAYLEQNELEKAGTAVTTALKLDAAHQPALLLHGTITEAYHDKGKAYLDNKRYTEAVEVFQKAINFDADLGNSSQNSPLENTHIHAHLGTAYIGMQAYQNAIVALEKAIALDPDLVDAHYNLGFAYVEQGHADKAIPHLERAIAIAPNLKRAHYNLARAHRELGNLAAATRALKETLRLDSNYQPAHELAHTIKQEHYNKGITYFNDEDYSDAVTAFQDAITLDPSFTTAHYNLGLTYLKMESYAQAVDALQKTVVLDPTHKAAHHTLALAYFGQQNLGKARDAAKEALKLDANYQPAISLLEAIDPSFTQSETQTPTPREPDQSVASQPDIKPRHQTHYELGIVYRDAKMYKEAVAEFRKARDLEPNFVAAHTNLGEIYLEVGQLDEAEKAAKAALRIDALSHPARQLLDAIKKARPPEPEQSTDMILHIPDAKKHYDRGEAYLNNKQYKEAAVAFQRAIKADPNFSDAHCGLGIAYLELGALDDATKAVEQASKLKANRQLVHELLTTIKRTETRNRKRERWKKGLAYAVTLTVIAAVGVAIYMFWPPGPDPDPKPIPKPKPIPALIEIGVYLEEPSLSSRNGSLDAGERARLMLTITNKGSTVYNVELRVEPLDPPSTTGLTFSNTRRIPELKDSIQTIRIPITADKNIKGRDQSLQIQLFKENQTKPFVFENFSFKIIPRTPKPERPSRR